MLVLALLVRLLLFTMTLNVLDKKDQKLGLLAV